MRRTLWLTVALLAMATVSACGTPVVITSNPVMVAQPEATIDLTKPPTLSVSPALSVPPIVTCQLANGLKIIVVKHADEGNGIVLSAADRRSAGLSRCEHQCRERMGTVHYLAACANRAA